MGYDFDDAGRDGGSPRRAGDKAEPYQPKQNKVAGAVGHDQAADGIGAENDKAWTKPKIGEERGLVIVRAADVSPSAVDWIWDGRIARGKLTIVAGAPDVGKSQIGAYIAARITNGAHWPNGADSAARRCSHLGVRG